MASEEALVHSDVGRPLGSIRDFLIDRYDGRVRYVALRGAGDEDETRTYLVPFHRLEWRAAEGRFDSRLRPAELSELPRLDAQTLALVRSDCRAERGWRRASRCGLARESTPTLLAGDCRGASVSAGPQALGVIADLVIDPEGGRVAFALVAPQTGPGRDPYVVPFGLLERPATLDGAERFVLMAGRIDLGEAPRLGDREVAVLGDPDVLERINRFYGIEPAPPPVQVLR